MEKNFFKKDAVQELLKQRGLSMREFSARAELSLSSVSAWMRGFREPKLSNIRKMAQALNCKVSDISEYGEEALDWNDELPAEPSPPRVQNTIQNTPQLRECIKDAMMREGVTDVAALNRLIGYDSVPTLSRLLSGKINFFPDVLSSLLDALHISHDDVPCSASERELLAPEGIYNDGAILIRPIPVVDWANAASYIGSLVCGTSAISQKWNPETTETIPAPVGVRKGTIALRVSGQSMEPKIIDGDKLYCEPVENIGSVPNNKIVVVRFVDDFSCCPGCLVCKRFRRIAGTICLTSDNPSPSSRSFENVPPESIAWIGKIVGKYDDDF